MVPKGGAGQSASRGPAVRQVVRPRCDHHAPSLARTCPRVSFPSRPTTFSCKGVAGSRPQSLLRRSPSASRPACRFAPWAEFRSAPTLEIERRRASSSQTDRVRAARGLSETRWPGRPILRDETDGERGPIASRGSIDAMLSFCAVTPRVSWQHGRAHRRGSPRGSRCPQRTRPSTGHLHCGEALGRAERGSTRCRRARHLP